MQKQVFFPVFLFVFFPFGNILGQDSILVAAQNRLDSLQKHQALDSSWEFVSIYNRMSDAYLNRKELDDAQHYIFKAKKLVEQFGKTNYEETVFNYMYQAELFTRKGNQPKQLEALEEGLAYTLSHSQKKETDLAFFYYRLGQYMAGINESERAIEYLNKAVSLIKPHAQTEEFKTALPVLYRQLGINYLNLKNVEQASYCFNLCLKLTDGQEGKLAARLNVFSILAIGSACASREEYDLARHYLNRADSILLSIEKNAENPDYFIHEFRKLRWIQGKICLNSGELEEAKKHFLEIAEQYPMKAEPWLDASIYFNLALVHEWQGDWEGALYYNHQSIILSCRTFDSPDYFDLPSYDDFRELGGTYWLINQKARYLARSSVIESDTVKKIRHYTAALEVIDLFDQYHGHNLKKRNFLRDGKSKTLIQNSTMAYKAGLPISLDAYRIHPVPEMLDKGFYYTQKMKAQQLWLTLLNSDATEFEKLPKALLEKERDLLSDIQRYEEKVLEARENKDSTTLDLYENKYLFESRRAYNALIQEMEASYPAYYEAKYELVPETAKTLQNILKENELLIEYIFGDSALFVFTIAQDQPLEMKKIELDTQIVDRVDDFNKLLQKSSWMRRSSRERFIALNYALYQQFIEPIEDQLAGKDRLIIIGDGMTNYIPFEALVSSDEIKPFSKLEYLIKNHEVSYHYSASLFAKARQKEMVESTGVFAFAPVYDQSYPQLALATSSKDNSVNPGLRAFGDDGSFSPLPESEKEVKAIIDLFSKDITTTNTLTLRGNAKESTLKYHLEKPYQIIHIAGHSFADLENPKFSGIACFKEKKSNPDSTAYSEDGILYAGEIYNLNTHADLVTLSSCESGYGKLEIAEGLLGLNRAFIYAGTPNVLFSLWKVYDKVSAELMVDFYENVLTGNSYSASLRQAKLNLLNKEATAAPHFWSPYLLIGR